jgi:hypothetical protein
MGNIIKIHITFDPETLTFHVHISTPIIDFIFPVSIEYSIISTACVVSYLVVSHYEPLIIFYFKKMVSHFRRKPPKPPKPPHSS